MLKIFGVRTGENPSEKVKKISWPHLIRNVKKSTFHTFFSKYPKNPTLPWNPHFGLGFLGLNTPLGIQNVCIYEHVQSQFQINLKSCVRIAEKSFADRAEAMLFAA